MVRVADQGHKSFCLAARFPLNPKNPTRRLLGNVGVLTLAEARDKAREWLLLISKGIDPKIEDERIRRTIERNQHLRFNTDGTEGVEFVSRRHPKATPRLIATAIDECLREEPGAVEDKVLAAVKAKLPGMQVPRAMFRDLLRKRRPPKRGRSTG